jgi:hypothetical protein
MIGIGENCILIHADETQGIRVADLEENRINFANYTKLCQMDAIKSLN